MGDFGVPQSTTTSQLDSGSYADLLYLLSSWGMSVVYRDASKFDVLATDPNTAYVRIGKSETEVVLVGRDGIDIFTIRFRGSEVTINGR